MAKENEYVTFQKRKSQGKSLNVPALRHKAIEFCTNPMRFAIYFRRGVPLTGLDHSSPIISGNYEVYQNHVIAYQWRNHNLGGGSTQFVKVTSLYCHGVMAPQDVFPSGSSPKAPTDVRIWCLLPIYNWTYRNLAKVTCPRNNDVNCNGVRLLNGLFSKSWLYVLSKFDDLRLWIAEDKKID